MACSVKGPHGLCRFSQLAMNGPVGLTVGKSAVESALIGKLTWGKRRVSEHETGSGALSTRG